MTGAPPGLNCENQPDRLFTFFVLAIRDGVVAVPTGLVTSAVSKSRELEEEHPATPRAISH